MTQFEQKESRVQRYMITLWPKDISELPSGWAVCDGNNGTPDVRDKFIKSTASSSNNPQQAGGTNTYTMDNSEMADHHHQFDTDSVGDHNHIRTTGASCESETVNIFSYDNNNSSLTSENGEHSHTITTNQVGSGNNIDNRPKFREAHIIMRL